MDTPIQPRPSNHHKPRIRMIRDAFGFTRYQVSHRGAVFVESLSFNGAWEWAGVYCKQLGERV